MDYLHWIGKQYYTQHRFIKEAERYGVTRRVSLNVAKQMHWGDRVFCAMLDGKTGVIFGSFIIAKLSGLSNEMIGQLETAHETEFLAEGGDIVFRGCGEYTEGRTCAIGCKLPDIISTLDNARFEGVDIGHPMVGGIFQTVTKIRLMDIPFRPGFRQIRAELLLRDARFSNRKVHGQYYVDDRFIKANEPNHLKGYGWIQAVKDYQQKKGGRRSRRRN